MTHHGWVLCPIEDDFIALEDMGFIIGKSKKIWMGAVDTYAYYVEGDLASLRLLKPYWGRYFWSIHNKEGEDDGARSSEERFRESKLERDLMQSSFL